jgi:hypothetical protein
MDKRKRPSEEPLDYGAYESEFTAQLEGQSLSHVAMENHNVCNRSKKQCFSSFVF